MVIDDKELDKLKPEATQSVDILEFVDANDIDSMLYDTPYYVEPDKRGRRAYSLLRESLKKTRQGGDCQGRSSDTRTLGGGQTRGTGARD